MHLLKRRFLKGNNELREIKFDDRKQMKTLCQKKKMAVTDNFSSWRNALKTSLIQDCTGRPIYLKVMYSPRMTEKKVRSLTGPMI